ncbi:MAG: efflux RND transporter periplasmic adaptor subunit [Kordiimonadaceae bacterium]|jgi:RND family efflux transporter MFP subunit|nr:efflux RND transporter periplasmic adaptor subunit [Kordiimonadaceae bacterium]MBT6035860.1 efflux RND transporter periplasmic adaptor subunit [Kordiimonadaceae bacterium]MBT6328185.1 efflux RND transporter periplasmic adaptor subunit [Kordiimonadaceae bacterium]MBT7583235.1 efflux RND transporter periplasmic adaptor subunit [Kordiimonadaceae bacterium]
MNIRRIIPGLIVIGVAASVSSAIFIFKPVPESAKLEILARTIRAVEATSTDVKLLVESQGTVAAKQVIDVIPQVSGEIQYVSPKFVAGGRFKKGEVIIKIDPRDYELAVITAEASIAERNQKLLQEEAESELAKAEWAQLGQGEASDLTLRKPQREGAMAALKSAEASLKRANLDLERTVLKAPFEGILTEKNVDLGQFLSRGNKVGKYYSTETLEIRLPLTNRDIAQFDLAGLQNGDKEYAVRLTGQFANKESSWNGRVVRTEGIIDVNSRILYVVAELKGGELFSPDGGTPITIGQFVSAQIEGRSFDNVVKLPRESLRQGNQVLIVDKDNKLRTRMVDVIEANNEYIVVASGIEDGDLVNLSQLGISVDGTLVETTTVRAKTSAEMLAASSVNGNQTITQEPNDE